MKAAIIGGAISILIVLIGWANSVESRLTSTVQRIERAERDGEDARSIEQSIDRRLSRIEGKLGIESK
jgi:hypothetical protein